jgi:hypothetical protein
MNIGGVVPQRTTFSTPPGGRCASGCYDQTDLYPDIRTSIAAIYSKYTAGGAGWYPSGYMLEGMLDCSFLLFLFYFISFLLYLFIYLFVCFFFLFLVLHCCGFFFPRSVFFNFLTLLLVC